MKLLKCYLCKSSLKPFLFKNNYQILKCDKCGLLQTDLRRDYATFVKEYYSKGYFSGDPDYYAYDEYDRDKPKENNNRCFNRDRNYGWTACRGWSAERRGAGG